MGEGGGLGEWGSGGGSKPAEEMQISLGAGDIEMSHRLDKRNCV